MNFRITHQFLVLLFILLAFSFHSSASQTTETIFQDIKLDQPLPTIFRAGEIFYLHGSISAAIKNPRISVSIDLIDGDYAQSRSQVCPDNNFSIPIEMKYVGVYYLNISINFDLKGTIILTAAEPFEINSKQTTPLSGIEIINLGFKSSLIWQSTSELIQIKITQNAIEKNFLLSNSPKQMSLDAEKFPGFEQGQAMINIRCARSQDGSWYTKCSQWGDWQFKAVNLVREVQVLGNRNFRYNKPFHHVGAVGTPISLDVFIKSLYGPEAYILRPDGWVDLVKLKSDKKITEYLIGGFPKKMIPKGHCELTYVPEQEGIYIIEINDRSGEAIINLPYYAGDCLPLLEPRATYPTNDSSIIDLELARGNMLDDINAIRANLNLKPLHFDSNLISLSQNYSDQMAREQFCGHVSPGGENIQHRKKKYKIVTSLSENVAKARSILEAHENLKRSPAHYLAMIDSSITLAGFGISKDDRNNYYIAQHFSTEPLTELQKNEFLTNLFNKINESRSKQKSIPKKKKLLTRIYEHSGWSPLNVLRITASSLKRIEELILIENSNTTWKREIVREVLFENFEQTADGIKLVIKFYPVNLTKQESKR
ncbi:hypothetical protein B6I21_05115 [candidate division KSB1 bacterium 4572_119]|nr:MAG: hypothetical protein B6I21_05115 [candidate division KSB1 bacterium 4572_119]